MIILLAMVLAGIAARLWSTRREPADRLRRAWSSLHPARFPGMRQKVEAPTFSPPMGTARDPSPRTIRGAPPRAIGSAPPPTAHDAFVGVARHTSASAARDASEGRTCDASAGMARYASAGRAREPRGRRRPGRGELVTAFAPGLAAFLAVGGLPGAVAGVVGFWIALAVLRRREPPELREERRRVTADLPLAADLMVACLRAGQPITGAIDVTVEAIGGPLGERLAWVSGQLRLGAAPESRLAGTGLRALARLSGAGHEPGRAEWCTGGRCPHQAVRRLPPCRPRRVVGGRPAGRGPGRRSPGAVFSARLRLSGDHPCRGRSRRRGAAPLSYPQVFPRQCRVIHRKAVMPVDRASGTSPARA